MRPFDFYEFTGVLVPGVLTLYLGALLFPDLALFAQGSGLSTGDLGLFLVLAYAAGHLLGAVGNLLESAYWKAWGGMPSDWVRCPKCTFMGPEQTALVQERLGQVLGTKTAQPLKDYSQATWPSVIRQINAAVEQAGLGSRVHTFNGNYGMFRGIAAGLLVTLLAMPWSDRAGWTGAAACVLTGLLAVARMHRFAKLYARELLVQFLAIPPVKEGSTPS